MWAHCSLTPWNITELKKELKSPAGSFQHSLTAASKTQRGTNEKKPTLFFSASSSSLSSNSYWCDGQTWLHGKKAGGIWQLAQQKGVQALQLVSVRACLQKLISWYPYQHTRTGAKMNEMLGLRPQWELIGGGRYFLIQSERLSSRSYSSSMTSSEIILRANGYSVLLKR